MIGLILRGLTYYWRTNLAVVLGVATAVAVLAGALLVGDSVRGSLRDLVVGRLGRTDYVVASSGFFREQLAATCGRSRTRREVLLGRRAAGRRQRGRQRAGERTQGRAGARLRRGRSVLALSRRRRCQRSGRAAMPM